MRLRRERLASELATTEAWTEDFQERIARRTQRFNSGSVDVVIRKLLVLARNDVDVDANQRLMPILLDIIQPVVMGRGTRPAPD